jgi:hypothetical protein
MDLVNFIVWLTAGAVIGWFANRMVTAQHEQRVDKPKPSGDGSFKKSEVFWEKSVPILSQ